MTREQLEEIRSHGRMMGHREAEHRFCPGGGPRHLYLRRCHQMAEGAG